MAIAEIMEGMKGRPMMALTAFALQIGLLMISLGKRKAIYSIEEKIENKKRLDVAFTNYGLK